MSHIPMNDTLDNYSFPNISPELIQISQANTLKSNKPKIEVSTQSEIDWLNNLSNISLDDSVFFDANLTPCKNCADDDCEKSSSEKNAGECSNINLSHALFSESDDNLFDLDESLKTTSSSKQNKSNKNLSDLSLGFSESWRASDTESSFINTNEQAKPVDLKFDENVSQQICKSNELSMWGLPPSILAKYHAKNVTTMFEWQVECLSNPKVLKNNANLVYSAPTSAGKTLVSEILTIKTIFEREKKAIFILPFVSVVREKMFYFQEIFAGSGVRADGFMGSYNPPGGFHAVHLAICTIEKANGLINKLLMEGTMSTVGAVIIDEMHLLGDPHRGYLLELLLTKLRYISHQNPDVSVQIIGMSATLPNLPLLAKWLRAELYVTDFRPIPLNEQAQIGSKIFNSQMQQVRTIEPLADLDADSDNILQLCLETIFLNCSVLIFCPTKNWCENLAQQIAQAFYKLGTKAGSELGAKLRLQLNSNQIVELLGQLKFCPVGLDSVLKKTVSFGVAFHHAGLTMDERDIIESAFRSGAIRVLVATSTLSSGVNLPARRVIIRTPLFHGKPLDSLVYRQMIGRAGRMGRDTHGESILLCQQKDMEIAKNLMSAALQPIESCLEGDGRLKRAILEGIASGVASTPQHLELFTQCTLLAQDADFTNPIDDAMEFLLRNEFCRLQDDGKYIATNLGKACLTSSIAPEEGLTLFTELEKARQCFVLETELHLIYLVTPYSACYQWGYIDWILYLDLWEKLPASMKKVAELVGVNEGFLVLATRGKIQSTATAKQFDRLMVHKRFFVALALQDLVDEKPLAEVCYKFNCNRGMLQSLQSSAATFAGMVTAFSKQLGWTSVEILLGQFQDRLNFGVSRDLLDLMRLPLLNGKCARVLFNAGIENLVMLANSRAEQIEEVLHRVVPFESGKLREGETEFERNERNKFRNIWITGKEGLTEKEAAELLVTSARNYLLVEMGLKEAKWESTLVEDKKEDSLHELSAMSELNIAAGNDVKKEQEFIEPKIPNSICEKQNKSILNSSSEIITNSENDDSISLANLSMTRHSLRKRKLANCRSFENSPSKRKKNIAKRKSIDFNAMEDFKFEIVNVCEKREIFDQFLVELKQQELISLNLAYERVEERKKHQIGILNDKTQLNKSGAVEENGWKSQFQYKNVACVGLSICWGGNLVYYLSLNEIPQALDAVIKIINQKKMTMRMFDGKEQIKMVKHCCHCDLKCKLEDAKILDWLIDPDGCERTFQQMLNVYCPKMMDVGMVCGSTKSRSSPSLDRNIAIDAKLRCCAESLANFHLVDAALAVLKEKNPQLVQIFKNEMKCVQCVTQMEINGIGVSLAKFKEIIETIEIEKRKIEKSAFNLAGRRFSLSAPKEVAHILRLSKKTGTSKRILQQNANPISDLILEWRKLSGIVNKMIEPLLRVIENDRIYGSSVFHTATGRISMHEPNLQSIAKDFKINEEILISCRDAFQPRDGYVLVSADYCQLELRLLTHFSQDELLCGVMRQQGDVFKSIAANWNKIREDQVDNEVRQRVKFICYGIIYGMGAKSLAEQMGIEEIDAAKFMETFKSTYPGLKKYMAGIVEDCKRKGYVKTLYGRRRYLPQINSENAGARGQAERQALNTTIQGSAADLVKKCMVDMEEKCQGFRIRPKLVLHLHDELLYEVPKSTVRKFALTLKETMEGGVGLSIPFPVKLKSGPSWGQLTEYNL